MTLHFKLPEQNAIAADAQRLLEAGVDREIVMGVLAKGGLSKIDSIRLMSELTGVPLLEAKNMVQNSRAWQHRLARDPTFQAQVAEALQALRDDECSEGQRN